MFTDHDREPVGHKPVKGRVQHADPLPDTPPEISTTDPIAPQPRAGPEAEIAKIRNVGSRIDHQNIQPVYCPRIVVTINDYDVRVIRRLGEHVWYVHDDTDEFFLVPEGRFDIAPRDYNGTETTVVLHEGDSSACPRAQTASRRRPAERSRCSNRQEPRPQATATTATSPSMTIPPPGIRSEAMVSRHIDLSHRIVDSMTTYPGLLGPVIGTHLSRQVAEEAYGPWVTFHVGMIEICTNTGTYLDVPFHRFPDGHDLTELSLDRIAGVEAICVDRPNEVAIEIGAHELGGWLGTPSCSGLATHVCSANPPIPRTIPI